jgi:hypothetical protein
MSAYTRCGSLRDTPSPILPIVPVFGRPLPKPCPSGPPLVLLNRPPLAAYCFTTTTLVVSAENAVNTPRPPTTFVNGSFKSRESCWRVA